MLKEHERGLKNMMKTNKRVRSNSVELNECSSDENVAKKKKSKRSTKSSNVGNGESSLPAEDMQSVDSRQSK